MRRTALLALVGLAVGCRNPLDLTSDDAPIRTDRTEYAVTHEGGALRVDIEFTYTNPTAGAVNVQACQVPDPPVLQKREDGKWVTAYAPVVLLCLGPPLVIPRGGSTRYALHVRAFPAGSNAAPQWQAGSVAGTYRLLWAVHAGDGKNSARDGGGPLVPVSQRVSNTFWLVE